MGVTGLRYGAISTEDQKGTRKPNYGVISAVALLIVTWASGGASVVAQRKTA